MKRLKGSTHYNCVLREFFSLSVSISISYDEFVFNVVDVCRGFAFMLEQEKKREQKEREEKLRRGRAERGEEEEEQLMAEAERITTAVGDGATGTLHWSNN